MKRQLQNRISESSLTLPIVAVAALVLWWFPDGQWEWLTQPQTWTWDSEVVNYTLGLLTCVVTTYILLEANASNALLRIRSRMISIVFLAMMIACGFLHPFGRASLTMLCLAMALYSLFRSYEKVRPQADIFHCYTAIAVGSLLWPPMLLLSVVLLWSQTVYLRNLTWSNFRAALIGLLMPYWLWAAWAYYAGELPSLLLHAERMIAPFWSPVQAAISGQPLLSDTYLRWLHADSSNEQFATLLEGCSDTWHATWAAMNNVLWDEGLTNVQTWASQRFPKVIAFIFVILMALTGFFHYARKSYDDKIRVRMLFYCFMNMQTATGLWLLMQPQLFNELFPMYLLTTSPLAAHFFALTYTKTTNLWFFLSVLMLITVAVFNL